MNAPGELRAFLPSHDSVFFSVSAADRGALMASGDPLGEILLLFRMEGAPVQEVASAVRGVFAGLEALARRGELERWYRLTWVVVGCIRHRRPLDEVDRLLVAAKEAIEDASRGREVRVMAQTAAEADIEKGMAIGEQKGRIAGKRETLLRLMQLKFGALPAEVEALLSGIEDPGRLDDLLARIVTATSLGEMGL